MYTNDWTTEWYRNNITKLQSNEKGLCNTYNVCPGSKLSPATTATNSSELTETKENKLTKKTPSLSLTKTAPVPNDQHKHRFIFGLDACDSELQDSHELPIQHIHFSHW